MLDELRRLSQKFLKLKNSQYRRYLIQDQTFDHRLSVIIGQRGVGKTTTLVQSLLDRAKGDRFDAKILYVQADHFQMGKVRLYEIADRFQMEGGRHLAIDEIHKYPDWSKELKSIYDTFPQLSVMASGSSALEIHKGSHDLVRRALCFPMFGMSFREFLEMSYGLKLPIFSLEEIVSRHTAFAEEVIEALDVLEKKVMVEFHRYLKVGYFPYFFELKSESAYKMTLEQNLHATVESDLTAIFPRLSGHSLKKMKDLIVFIANSVPFTVNWTNILKALDVGDVRTVKGYFKHLEQAQIIRSLPRATDKFSRLESAEKVFLDNPNQLCAISTGGINQGTLRETFLLSMLAKDHRAAAPKNGDFVINGDIVIEVGGASKTARQIKSEKNGYLACDNLEVGAGRKIPLWLFGCLY